MNRDGPPERRPRRPLALAIFGLALAAAFLLSFWFSSPRLPPTARVALVPHTGDDPLEPLTESLTRENQLAACRAFVPQMNEYLARHPEQQAPALAAADQAQLRQTFGLSDDELHEINSGLFTPLDAHYLEQCFLLRDAARGLELEGLSDVERAGRAFDWVVRQVRLRDGEPPACPPLYVLRRGWGTAWERSMVFLALLEQLGIPGCLITCPGAKGQHFWLAGAVVQDKVYLFEPNLGVPLPGPGGREVATLAQVRREPGLLAPLGDDYEVKAGQAQKAEAYPAPSLSALAPRMARLQKALVGAGPVLLGSAPAELQRRWQQAGVTGRPALGGADGPTRVLRSFLPPSDGGIDQPSAEPPWTPRTIRYRVSLSAREYLPALIRDQDATSPLRQHLRDLFDHEFEDYATRPDGPRDRLLRGRLEQATAGLVAFLDKLDDPLDMADDPKVEAAAVEWCAMTEQAQAAVLRAKQVNDPTALKGALERLKELSSKEKIEPMLRLIRIKAAPPLRTETAYLLALCKHEQAERAQALFDRKQTSDAAAVREAWQTAADRWSQFLDGHPGTRSEASARLLGARAREALGQRAAALALVQDPPARLGVWERRMCLYRARLLQGRSE